MSVNDPISDMLTRIRNAGMARQTETTMPSTKILVAITGILKQEGYIADFNVVEQKPQNKLVIKLSYAADKTHADKQLSSFNALLERLGPKCNLTYISAANSATTVDLSHGHYNTVRPGIVLYGLPPSHEMHKSLDLRPAMQLKTRIVYIKEVPVGTTVSYGCTYATDRTTFLATLPVGYADGYSRHLSSRASVLIGGKRRPVVGRVCMDQTVVDLGPDGDAAIGDEAVLFGRQGHGEITLTELADLTGTINYELACAVSARVPRVYVNE